VRSVVFFSSVLFVGCATAVDIGGPIPPDAAGDTIAAVDSFVPPHDTAIEDTYVPEVETDSGPCGLSINEVQTGDGSTGTADFVELYNSCASSRSLSGYKLAYRSSAGTTDVVVWTFDSGATITGKGYVVIGGTGFSGSKDGTLSSGLAVGGGGVGLRDASDSLIDSVGYGSATNAFVEGTAAAAPGDSTPAKSIARKPNGSDSNDNGADFAVGDPTPGGAN
jgi:hypothetical protein